MPVKVESKGSYKRARIYMAKAKVAANLDDIQKVAEETVKKLKNVSPYESIAEKWSYQIEEDKEGIKLYFNNSYVNNGVNIALLVDTGHATSGGHWVAGKHYIQQPVQDAFDKILDETWRKLKRL